MRYGSVCSGIEAASVAWQGFGWEPAWLAEIEPFPSAVLAHHYPDVPNLGDMTTLPARILAGEIEAPDILVGGTPCQSFSVAGLRKGLADPRGQLTRTYVEILDALDTVRDEPALCVWENVPGVLSDKDNAFGNFLGALAGEDAALEPPRGKWTNAGLVLGPTREVAWRVLDAQYFGVAQRRRRVFVVAGSPAGRIRPSQVLLVEQGVRRDSPPSREAGQRVAARAGGGASSCGYPELHRVVGTLSDGAHNGGGSTDRTPTAGASCRSYPEVPEVAWCLQHRDSKGADSDTKPGHLLPVGGFFEPVAFDTTQVTHPENRSQPRPGAPCHPLAAGAHAPAIAFDARQSDTLIYGDKTDPLDTDGHSIGVCVTGDRTHALKAEGADASEDGTGRGTPIIGVCVTGDRTRALTRCEGATEDGTGRGTPIVPARSVALRGRDGGATAELGGEQAGTLRAATGGGDKPHVLASMAVRRLTPVECERLQGFPDGYTAIPWKGKPVSECPDGPRYKALGNSMAVPVMRWIGKKIVIASL